MTTSLATVFAAPGAVTGYAAIAVAVLMVALWLASIALRDVSIVDPAWGPAFVLVGAVALVAGGGCLGRRWLLFAMTAVWGLRLGTYLLVRMLGSSGEDRRYAAMRDALPHLFEHTPDLLYQLVTLVSPAQLKARANPKRYPYKP